MRKPDRIPIVLEKIHQVWKSNPDYRLGQLICVLANIGNPKVELFNIEEEDLIVGLEKFINRNEKIEKLEEDRFWEKYPDISKIKEEEITIELVAKFIDQLKLENNNKAISATNLMKLNNAPVSDENWMKKQHKRIKKINEFLTKLEEQNLISESEIVYRYI